MERADWDRRYESTELVWTASPNRFVVDELTGLRPGVALDLGTGEGRNAVWLATQGWTVTAVDFSAVGLAKAHRLAQSRGVRVKWVAADLRDYVPDPRAFDLVLIAYLHLPRADWTAILRRAMDAVAPAGTLLVIGHDLANLTEGVGGPQDPSRLYTVESISAELDGLEIQHCARVTRPVDTEAGPREAIDTLVRAVRT
jgi:SAM-dependent methyltransferase